MKSLIIVCAGGFGRDVLSLVQRYNIWRPTWDIKGFIDDNPDALANVRCNYKVLGSIKDWQPKSDEDFVIGVAQPQAKEKVVTMLKEKGAHFASIVFPDTLLSDYCEVGEGSLLWGTSVGDNANIGRFVHAFGAAIGQQSEIGDFSTITNRVNTTTAKIVALIPLVIQHSIACLTVQVIFGVAIYLGLSLATHNGSLRVCVNLFMQKKAK